MATQSTLRVGFVGAGVQAWESQIPAFQALADENVDAVAIADPDFEQAARVAEERRIGRVFRDADQMIAEAAPDLVVIATPLRFHYAEAQRALAAGCHVLLEKPATRYLFEAMKLAATARRAGLVFAVGYQYPYQCQKILDVLRVGLIGRRTYVSGAMVLQNAYPLRKGYWDSPEAGGVLYDYLGHPLSVAMAAALERGQVPTYVTSHGWNDHGVRRFGPEFRSQDTATVTVACSGNVEISLEVSWAGLRHEFGLRVDGVDGEVDIPLMGAETDASRFSPSIRRRTSEGSNAIDVRGLDLLPTPTEEAFVLQGRAVCQAIRTGQPLTFDATLAIQIQAVLEAAARSISRGGEQAAVERAE